MDKTLLEILACPSCKGSLDYMKAQQELVCPTCRLAYPIRDDIPVMLSDEARELAADEEL
ncbi:tetraacyldisaccharide 4'-kinase [Methylophaga sp. 42_25_T18]|nr:tetraacyldisaccharide 4'-kinase [Methylophaga sp. 42_25_T18]OUR88167.1 tetraacyldisaccharide 4'-kinase [Methylophaga sp. 42_8_T64]